MRRPPSNPRTPDPSGPREAWRPPPTGVARVLAGLALLSLLPLGSCVGPSSSAGGPLPVDAPAPRRSPFTFVHLGELELETRAAGAPPRAEPGTAARDRLARELRGPQQVDWLDIPPLPPPEFAIVTGDLTAAGASGDTWEAVRTWLDGLGLAWFAVAGERDLAWSAVEQRMRRRHGSFNHSFDHGGVHFVQLLGGLPGLLRPVLDGASLLWLQRDLERVPRGQPLVVSLAPSPAGDRLAQPAQLVDLLDVLDGHEVALLLHGGVGEARGYRLAGIDSLGAAPLRNGGGEALAHALVSFEAERVRVLWRSHDGGTSQLVDQPLPVGSPREPFVVSLPDDTPVRAGQELSIELISPLAEPPQVRVDGAEAEAEWSPPDRPGAPWRARVRPGAWGAGVHLLTVRTPSQGLGSAGTGPRRGHLSALRFVVVDEQVELLWRRPLGAGLLATPILRGDLIVVASRTGRVRGLDRESGRTLWRRQLPGMVVGNPVQAGGVTILGCGSGDVLAFERDGRVRWRRPQGVEVYGAGGLAGGVSPRVPELALIGDDLGRLHAFHPGDGRQTWSSARASGAIWSAPAQLADLVVFGDARGEVLALEAATGTLRWRSEGSAPAGVDVARAVRPGVTGLAVAGGRAFVCDDGGRVRAFDPAGGSAELGITDAACLAASPDGAFVTVRGRSGRLTRLDDQGREVWRRELGPCSFPVPPVERDGRIAVVSDEGLLAVLDAADGQVLWSWRVTPGSYVAAQPALARDGAVYVGDLDGTLTALRWKRGP